MKVILFANTDWYLYNFRFALAEAIRSQGHEVVLLSPAGSYAARMQTAGFRWQEIKIERSGLNPFVEAASLWQLWTFYRRERPDLVHQFTVKPVLYGSIAALLAGVPVIINSVTGLGYIFTGRRDFLRRLVSPLYRLVFHSTWCIFQNPDDQAAFTSQGLLEPGRVCLIRGSGVDTNRFQPRPELGGTPLIVLPARLLWDKGVGEFVQAAGLLQERGVEAHFVLAGDIDPGNPSSISADQIRVWEEKKVVKWWGWQEDMLEVYARANLVCLPSYREGLPKTLIEAAACGRAIVATDVPGCREIVRNNENGLLVPVRDPARLADAIQYLVENPAIRRQMAENGRMIAVSEFDVKGVVQSTLDFYHQAQTSEWASHGA